jgi:putative NIF3 family GTP cyclohydrolase 1 type 2
MTLSIQQAVDRIKARFEGKVGPNTVDTIKSGDPTQPLRGIAVTFMATRQVLDQAVARGANLLITHEPTFYNHLDDEDWLRNDPVYESKRKFIDQHGITVWRVHDYPHVVRPDMIFTGMARELGWQDRIESSSERTIRLPAITLHELAGHCKKALGIKTVRYAGDPNMPCSLMALRVGSPGGRAQIDLLKQKGVDVVVTGESAEWETCEYVRDSAAAGEKKALLVLGHANSEEGGIRWMSEWIASLLPEIPVTYLPAGDPFRFV